MESDKTRVYDLPTRIFHWFFAASFLTAYSIGQFVDDESMIFPYHKLIGLVMVFAVLLRVIWGIGGSHYAKFTSFNFRFKELQGYFKALLQSRTKRYLGHNPASSYAAIAMFAMALGLGFTGVMMSLGINRHFFEEVHETLASLLLALAALHLVGVIFHEIRHHDGLFFSMITGIKQSITGAKSIASSHITSAVVFVLLLLGFTGYLQKNYDSQNQELSIFGKKLQLGEDEHEEKDHHGYDEYDDD